MKKVFILLVVICFTMCQQKTQTGDTVFVDPDRPDKASLFDYFSSIELIPLETSPEAPIAGITKIVIHQERYYVLDPTQCIIFVFDTAGKFLFKIDKKGKGPGEYSFIEDFNINPFSGNLELLEPYGRMHTYDLPGTHIETKRVTFPGFRAVHQFVALDEHTYVFHALFQPEKIIYYNFDENRLLHEEFEENRRLGSFANNPYRYGDNWYFFRPIHPVVYKIGKERLEPAFRFDFGTHTRETVNFSKEAERDLSKSIEELFAQSPYMLQAVRHNSKYVFASLFWKDAEHKANIIYDKSAGKSKFVLEFTEQVIFNSYRGEEIIVTDEYVLMPCQWADLDKRIKKEMLDDRNKAIFEALLQSETELNPVLIKYRFK